MTQDSPARLHILLARNALSGVIIRRGPSKVSCSIGWNRADDTFLVGQWLKGRIYERRSDLSPDGQYLIYFALNGRWQSESAGAWSAISRAPYLKAIGFWPNGTTYGGGGLFPNNITYWLNVGDDPTSPVEAPLKRAQHVELYPGLNRLGPDFQLYFTRLLRDGWAITQKKELEFGERHSVFTFEKSIDGVWLLRKFAHAHWSGPAGMSPCYDTHELENILTGDKLDGANWDWADVDRHRVVWTTAGKLFAASVTHGALIEPTLLRDFNQMSFERLVAPY
jgi:hypothetical protein